MVQLTFIDVLPPSASRREHELQRAKVLRHTALVSHTHRRLSNNHFSVKLRKDSQERSDPGLSHKDTKAVLERSLNIDISTNNYYLSNAAETCTVVSAWTQLAPFVSRSQQALDYWAIAVPTAAWSYPAVLSVMESASLLLQSLRRKDDGPTSAAVEMQALEKGNKCVRDLITAAEMPPEVIIICATFFWVVEFLSGRPMNALRHLAAGTQISRTLDLNSLSDPTGACYLRSFIKDLPASVNPEMVTKMSRREQEFQKVTQYRYSLDILRDAVERCERFRSDIYATQSPHSNAALQIVDRTMVVLRGIAGRWPVRERAEEEEDTSAAHLAEAILLYSPFIIIIEDAHRFIEDHVLECIREFERKLRPAIDFFVWCCASQQLSFRHHLIEIWDRQRPAHPLTNLKLATSR